MLNIRTRLVQLESLGDTGTVLGWRTWGWGLAWPDFRQVLHPGPFAALVGLCPSQRFSNFFCVAGCCCSKNNPPARRTVLTHQIRGTKGSSWFPGAYRKSLLLNSQVFSGEMVLGNSWVRNPKATNGFSWQTHLEKLWNEGLYLSDAFSGSEEFSTL